VEAHILESFQIKTQGNVARSLKIAIMKMKLVIQCSAWKGVTVDQKNAKLPVSAQVLDILFMVSCLVAAMVDYALIFVA
jgi:hypothetical protein